LNSESPFCTQVGHTGPVMPSETGRPVPYLDEVSLTFPELTIVGEHIVYIDTSASLPNLLSAGAGPFHEDVRAGQDAVQHEFPAADF